VKYPKGIMFQFLLGRLETIRRFFGNYPDIGFQFLLGRLETCGEIKMGLHHGVSIPLR